MGLLDKTREDLFSKDTAALFSITFKILWLSLLHIKYLYYCYQHYLPFLVKVGPPALSTSGSKHRRKKSSLQESAEPKVQISVWPNPQFPPFGMGYNITNKTKMSLHSYLQVEVEWLLLQGRSWMPWWSCWDWRTRTQCKCPTLPQAQRQMLFVSWASREYTTTWIVWDWPWSWQTPS